MPPALIGDRIAAEGTPPDSFAETYRTTCPFLGNPLNSAFRGIEGQRAVLELAFAGRLE